MKSDDPIIKDQARSSLITMYLNQEDFDKAKQLIEQLPDVNVVDKKMKLADLYCKQDKLDQAVIIIEERLLSQVNEILTTMIKLQGIALQEKRFDDPEILAEKYYQLAKSCDCWKYNYYLGYFELYSKTKNKLKLITTITKMFKGLTEKW